MILLEFKEEEEICNPWTIDDDKKRKKMKRRESVVTTTKLKPPEELCRRREECIHLNHFHFFLSVGLRYRIVSPAVPPNTATKLQASRGSLQKKETLVGIVIWVGMSLLESK